MVNRILSTSLERLFISASDYTRGETCSARVRRRMISIKLKRALASSQLVGFRAVSIE